LSLSLFCLGEQCVLSIHQNRFLMIRLIK
jgi:hypothetical protein